jgi:hypothetical protein
MDLRKRQLITYILFNSKHKISARTIFEQQMVSAVQTKKICKCIFHHRLRQILCGRIKYRPDAINNRFHRVWFALSEKRPSIQLSWNTFKQLISYNSQAQANRTNVTIVPVFLSSNLMMQSSPLLTTLSAPSHTHLLTFHSSALDHVTTSFNRSFPGPNRCLPTYNKSETEWAGTWSLYSTERSKLKHELLKQDNAHLIPILK